MGSAEDAQARALQKISQHSGEIVKVLAALNENVLGLTKILKTAFEKTADVIDENQLTIDELRAKAEADEESHELREQEEADDAANNQEGRIW